MIDCDCKTWAVEDMRAMMLGNGHHPNCDRYVANVGAVDLLAKLAAGIATWAKEEDGVPDWLWESYERAVFITKGIMPNVHDLIY